MSNPLDSRKNKTWVFYQQQTVFIKLSFKQDSKELSPRPLANAPKAFNSKKNSAKLVMLKGSLSKVLGRH